MFSMVFALAAPRRRTSTRRCARRWPSRWAPGATSCGAPWPTRSSTAATACWRWWIRCRHRRLDAHPGPALHDAARSAKAHGAGGPPHEAAGGAGRPAAGGAQHPAGSADHRAPAATGRHADAAAGHARPPGRLRAGPRRAARRARAAGPAAGARDRAAGAGGRPRAAGRVPDAGPRCRRLSHGRPALAAAALAPAPTRDEIHAPPPELLAGALARRVGYVHDEVARLVALARGERRPTSPSCAPPGSCS
jgi:hypothetical protein